MAKLIPLPMDDNGDTIQCGSDLRVVNIDVPSGAWIAVNLPEDFDCKSVMVRERTGQKFLLSHDSSGSEYITIDANLTLNIAKEAGETLFYVKPGGTYEIDLELLLVR